MSLSPEQYIALSELSYVSFKDSAKGHTLAYQIEQKSIPDDVLSKTSLTCLNNPDSTLRSYTLLSTTTTPSGFHASAFRSPTGEVVYAFAGTEGFGGLNTDWSLFSPDAKADSDIAWGRYTEQFGEAEAFVRDTQNKHGNPTDYSFTGHSLGGGLAQYMTAKTGKKATTFNAVGVGQTAPLGSKPDASPFRMTVSAALLFLYRKPQHKNAPKARVTRI